MCLQYGRFCFASGFRDLFAVGVPRMAVGIMIAMLAYGCISAFLTATGSSTFHAANYGWHAVIAGFIFAAGMVFAGGCASGTLYKAGEGNVTSMLAFVSFTASLTVLADIGGWLNALVPSAWHESALAKDLPAQITAGDGLLDQYLAGYLWNLPTLTFGEWLGSENAWVSAYVGNVLLGIVLPVSLLLAVIYAIWYRKGYLHKRDEEGKRHAGLATEFGGLWSMLAASKRTAVVALILGIASGLHMYVMKGMQLKFGVENFGTIMTELGLTSGLSYNGTVFDPGYWTVATQQSQWFGWVFNELGWDLTHNIYFGFANGLPNPLLNPAGWMSIALIGGAAAMALVNNEFKWKNTTPELAVWAIIGGILMGIGARLGQGCNVGAFFVRASQGDVSGWMFGIGMIGGAYLGVKLLNWWTERKMAKEMAAFDL
ncbi:MAG: YeeE/YedE thiosulfate transporter family protein [Pseudomonadota bacterium]